MSLLCVIGAAAAAVTWTFDDGDAVAAAAAPVRPVITCVCLVLTAGD